MKKVLLILLFVFATTILVACGSNASEKDAAQENHGVESFMPEMSEPSESEGSSTIDAEDSEDRGSLTEGDPITDSLSLDQNNPKGGKETDGKTKSQDGNGSHHENGQEGNGKNGNQIEIETHDESAAGREGDG